MHPVKLGRGFCAGVIVFGGLNQTTMASEDASATRALQVLEASTVETPAERFSREFAAEVAEHARLERQGAVEAGQAMPRMRAWDGNASPTDLQRLEASLDHQEAYWTPLMLLAGGKRGGVVGARLGARLTLARRPLAPRFAPHVELASKTDGARGPVRTESQCTTCSAAKERLVSSAELPTAWGDSGVGPSANPLRKGPALMSRKTFEGAHGPLTKGGMPRPSSAAAPPSVTPPMKTIVESEKAEREASLLKGPTREAYEKIKETLARGNAGGNQHFLRKELRGQLAIDLPDSGKGRGAKRVLFRQTEHEVYIEEVGVDYH